MKRALDVGLSAILTVVLSPLVILLAIGAGLSLRSWPFFAQRRVGRYGREFWVFKIRTLPRTTAAYANKYDIAEVSTSRYCATLRRLHLDELPQVILVLFGTMSLVGPRPEMKVLHDEMDPAFARLRTSVRPGCSGLWQIGPAAGGLIGEVPQYDRFYVEHATVRLDLWILWRTCRTVTRGGGERTLDEIPAWALRAKTPVNITVDVPGPQPMATITPMPAAPLRVMEMPPTGASVAVAE